MNETKLVPAAAFRAFFPRLPPYLIFFVTRRCQARCPFCFARVNGEDAGEELTAAEVRRIAEQWRGLIQVTLTGGEPFLREDLLEVALAFRKSGAKSLTLDSNGLSGERIVRVVNELLRAWPGLFLDLDLSLDGPPEVHDRLRGAHGAYKRVIGVAGELASLQERFPAFRLGATVTVSKFNEETAADTVKELLGSGLFRRVQALWVRGRPADPTALAADFSAYERCAKLLAEAAPASRGIRQVLSRRVRDTVMRTVKEKHALRPCRAGVTMVTLDADGRVYPCEMLPQLKPEGDPAAGIASWVMGSLREDGYSIRRVMNSCPARQIQKWIATHDCFCSFECAAYNNLVFHPREWPGILWEIIRK